MKVSTKLLGKRHEPWIVHDSVMLNVCALKSIMLVFHAFRRKGGYMRNTVASLLLMVSAIASIIEVNFPCQQAYGQSLTDWNGTWRGSWGGQADTSVTIFDGKVARYEYRGQPIPVTVFKMEGSMITFGVPGKYAVRIVRTGSKTATANYKNLHNDETAVADLERY